MAQSEMEKEKIKKIKAEYDRFVLEFNKLKQEQKQILLEYRKKLEELKINLIKEKISKSV